MTPERLAHIRSQIDAGWGSSFDRDLLAHFDAVTQVTDAMVDRACVAFYGSVWMLWDADPTCVSVVATDREHMRRALTAALGGAS